MSKNDTTAEEPKQKTIAEALLAAQRKIGAATKGAKNPFYKSAYATLGDVMEACKEPCNEEGITILQPVGMTDSGLEYLETILLHESGTQISSRMRLDPPKRMVAPPKAKEGDSTAFTPYLAPDPQAQGSAISYARRYALQSMLFIPSKDDDGESAMGRNKSHNATQEDDEF